MVMSIDRIWLANDILTNFKLFKDRYGLQNIGINQEKEELLDKTAEVFLKNYRRIALPFTPYYKGNCIYAACLASWILRTRPIESMGEEQRTYGSDLGLLHQDINEKFALHLVLGVLKIKDAYIPNREIHYARIIESFRLRNEHVPPHIKSLIEDVQQLCNLVPDYIWNEPISE